MSSRPVERRHLTQETLAAIDCRVDVPEAKRPRVETFVIRQILAGHSMALVVEDVVAKLRTGAF